MALSSTERVSDHGQHPSVLSNITLSNIYKQNKQYNIIPTIESILGSDSVMAN